MKRKSLLLVILLLLFLNSACQRQSVQIDNVEKKSSTLLHQDSKANSIKKSSWRLLKQLDSFDTHKLSASETDKLVTARENLLKANTVYALDLRISNIKSFSNHPKSISYYKETKSMNTYVATFNSSKSILYKTIPDFDEQLSGLYLLLNLYSDQTYLRRKDRVLKKDYETAKAFSHHITSKKFLKFYESKINEANNWWTTATLKSRQNH